MKNMGRQVKTNQHFVSFAGLRSEDAKRSRKREQVQNIVNERKEAAFHL